MLSALRFLHLLILFKKITVKNKLINLFATANEKLLNVYCTAGYPMKDSTGRVLMALQNSKVDIIEIGIPYSDPIADGPTIQESNMIAIENGMTIELLFKQLHTAKNKIHTPIILMGYLNPVMQYGIEKFCNDASAVGVAGIILPDLPMLEYENIYKAFFQKNNLSFIFLITPQTSLERIKKADSLSTGFIYAVSSNSTTGSSLNTDGQTEYFKKISKLKLKNPLLIGFGINNKLTFDNASKYAAGAIVGSAYIKAIAKSKNLDKSTATFIKTLR